MADDPGEPVELYRAGGLPEAQALCLLLEAEGIPARIDNDLLSGAVGELPAGWATSPRVLVGRAHEKAARAVLAAFLDRPARAPAGDGPDQCLACGAVMEGATCPSCGWSYADPEAHPDEPAGEPAEPESGNATPLAPAADLPELSAAARRALWAEVGAVLAVGVIPHLVASVSSLTAPGGPIPYWLDSLQLAVLSGCTISVVLYLIARSGEPREHFGLTRPNGWDVPLGLVLLLMAVTLVRLAWDIVPAGSESSKAWYPRPQGAAEYAMMAVKYAASGFAEELVTRAYLITRLRALLRSPAGAVVASAVVFASYHAYQGATGAVYALLLGLAYGGVFLLVRRVWPPALGHALTDVRAELLVP